MPVDKLIEDRMGLGSPKTTEFEIDLYATHALDPEYITETGCAKIGCVKADVSGSVGRPKSERKLDLFFAFGRTEIEVQSRDPSIRTRPDPWPRADLTTASGQQDRDDFRGEDPPQRVRRHQRHDRPVSAGRRDRLAGREPERLLELMGIRRRHRL